MSGIINRRKFLGDTAYSAAGIMLGSKITGSNLTALSHKGDNASSS